MWRRWGPRCPRAYATAAARSLPRRPTISTTVGTLPASRRRTRAGCTPRSSARAATSGSCSPRAASACSPRRAVPATSGWHQKNEPSRHAFRSATAHRGGAQWPTSGWPLQKRNPRVTSSEAQLLVAQCSTRVALRWSTGIASEERPSLRFTPPQRDSRPTRRGARWPQPSRAPDGPIIASSPPLSATGRRPAAAAEAHGAPTAMGCSPRGPPRPAPRSACGAGRPHSQRRGAVTRGEVGRAREGRRRLRSEKHGQTPNGADASECNSAPADITSLDAVISDTIKNAIFVTFASVEFAGKVTPPRSRHHSTRAASGGNFAASSAANGRSLDSQ